MRLACTDEGAGRPVVLLHGFPLSRAMWQEQISVIGQRYRLIVPDLRGHGNSPAPEGVYTMDEMADDVVELLDALHIADSIVLGGLSMGGYVAFSLVGRYPDRIRGLLLMDTRAAADSAEAARDREANARVVLEADSAHPIVAKMVPRLFGKLTLEEHPERVEVLRNLMERTPPLGIAGALRGTGAAGRPASDAGPDRGSHTRSGRRAGCDHAARGSQSHGFGDSPLPVRRDSRSWASGTLRESRCREQRNLGVRQKLGHSRMTQNKVINGRRDR